MPPKKRTAKQAKEEGPAKKKAKKESPLSIRVSKIEEVLMMSEDKSVSDMLRSTCADAFANSAPERSQ